VNTADVPSPSTNKSIHYICGALKRYLQHMVEKHKEQQEFNTLKNPKKVLPGTFGKPAHPNSFFMPLCLLFASHPTPSVCDGKDSSRSIPFHFL
jgi:hypothetical protein